mgnify:CR=1 FL=1
MINKVIKELFKRRWTSDLSDAPIEKQRAQIYKTLDDQRRGLWSGHTAYHLVIDGGFLKDAKSGVNKELTAIGKEFMLEMEDK